MRKLIAAINMTLDGFADHTAVDPDEETHQHFADLLKDADALIYGRTTYQLMEDYWPTVVETPTGDKSTDDFAMAIDEITKIVYSRTLKQVTWKNSILKHNVDPADILNLKEQAGKDIFVGSPGMIVTLTNLNLIDEYQILMHPVIAAKGLPLFKDINNKVQLKLVGTKPFRCGAINLYYEPKNLRSH